MSWPLVLLFLLLGLALLAALLAPPGAGGGCLGPAGLVFALWLIPPALLALLGGLLGRIPAAGPPSAGRRRR